MSQDPRTLAPKVRADVMSPMALDLTAEAIRRNAFAFRNSTDYTERYTPPERTTYGKPYTGTFQKVMAKIAAHDASALALATEWHVKNPGDVAAIIALGEALEANGAGTLAARAYGSIADLYPNRAELLRAAGERLDRTGKRALAIDFYQRAIRERPDHVSTYRLLAWSLFRANRPEEALQVLTTSLQHARRASVERILTEDASIIAANIVARHPERRYDMTFPIATSRTLRFTLTWETDATDVDLHVRDGRGGHAYYKGSNLSSGGTLIDDLTDGYGPEMFVVENPQAFPYKLSAHYYNKGPMGVGLGTVHVIRHDGAGGVIVEDRPFAIQRDDAMVELGTVAR
jgi:tetratricopeptide (TPR) repeat protein